jgi:RND family efflux transporter MFP subunit
MTKCKIKSSTQAKIQCTALHKVRHNIVLIGLLLLTPTLTVQAETNSQSSYQTATLTKVLDQRTVSLPTVSQAKQMTKLYSRASGYIKEQYMEIGSAVSKGDVLAVIDAPEIKLQEQQILVDIEFGKAEHELNRLTLKRAKQLIKDNLISKAELDRLTIQTEKSKAKIASLFAQKEQNQFQQSLLIITAPIAGYITDKNIEIGDMINGGSNPLNNYLYKLQNIDDLKLITYVPQNEVSKISIGDTINATFTGYEEIFVSATITRMAHAINVATGTMKVEAEFDNSKHNLPTGLNGIINFKIKNTKLDRPRWNAPLAALTYHQGGPAIATVSENNIQFQKINIVSQSTDSFIFVSPNPIYKTVILNPNALLNHITH